MSLLNHSTYTYMPITSILIVVYQCTCTYWTHVCIRFELELSDSVKISTLDAGRHWKQAAALAPNELTCKKNEKLAITTRVTNGCLGITVSWGTYSTWTRTACPMQISGHHDNECLSLHCETIFNLDGFSLHPLAWWSNTGLLYLCMYL